jgi:carbonic anhydrase
MYEIIWQYDETAPDDETRPATAAEARRLLVDGNHAFAQFFAPHAMPGETTRYVLRVSRQDVGLGGRPGEAPTQEPFAAFLSCADARVPVELIFGQQANELFVVRVAGNVLGMECLGSLNYVVDRLRSVRLLAVLGHTGCGAVTAAVDAYLAPATYMGTAASSPLEAIVGQLMPPVRAAAQALAAVYGEEAATRRGHHGALVETAVILNAALGASVLTRVFQRSLGDRLQVSFGVYDLRHRTVGLPGDDGQWQTGLFAPPGDAAGFEQFGRRVAQSAAIHDLLDATPG